MEIDIPDLDDLRFVTDCLYCDHGVRANSVDLGKGKRPRWQIEKVACEYCNGTGKKLTAVGERLLEFLGKLGIETPVPGGWAT